MFSGLPHLLLDLPAWLVLLLVGALVFAEDALFIGFVLPAETAAVLGGVAAKLGHVPLGGLLLTVIVAAIAGDSVGYEVGRRLGPRLLGLRLVAGHRPRLDAARDLLARRGGSAVFLGRWVAFLRAVVPAMAGMSAMPYPRFLAYNAAGGVGWGAVVVMVGYLAGASYARIEKDLGRGAAVVVAVIAVSALLLWRVAHHHRERRSR